MSARVTVVELWSGALGWVRPGAVGGWQGARPVMRGCDPGTGRTAQLMPREGIGARLCPDGGT